MILICVCVCACLRVCACWCECAGFFVCVLLGKIISLNFKSVCHLLLPKDDADDDAEEADVFVV